MSVKIDAGFVKGQSDNLPKIDSTTMAFYLSNNSDFVTAETRGVKVDRSARESYGDNAIGYVQVKREGNLCIVKGKITPEHRIRTKAYSVILVCDEKQEFIVSVKCNDCVASLGGCKHTVAFLAWVHRRSEEPSPTSVACYWKKSRLSSVGITEKFIKGCELSKKCTIPLPAGDGNFLKEFVEMCQKEKVNCPMASYFSPPSNQEKMSIHFLIQEFKVNKLGTTPEEFSCHAFREMTEKICNDVAKATMSQADCPLWHELRYGRITASKAYEAAHCKTDEGSLTESILGARFKGTEPMKRGQVLEKPVISVLKKTLNKSIRKSGFLLNSDYPMFGASPDGICDDFIVEIKCPMSESTMKTYFSNGVPSKKPMAQMQIQMLFAKKTKALFCVAHPDFEETKNITTMWVDFDGNICNEILHLGFQFWCRAIFPRL